MNKKTVIFALDGVLVKTNHKLYHSKLHCNCGIPFFPSGHWDIINFKIYSFYIYFKRNGYQITIFTNRKEKYRRETIKWLQEYNIDYDLLEMRSNDDFRPSYVVKEEFLKNFFLLYPEHIIGAVFEADKDCFEMYKLNSIKNVYDCKKMINLPFF